MVKDKPVKKTKDKPVKKTNERIIEDWIGDVKNLHKIRHTNVYDNRYRTDVFTYYKLDDSDLYYRYNISQSYFVAVINGEVVNLTQTAEPEGTK